MFKGLTKKIIFLCKLYISTVNHKVSYKFLLVGILRRGARGLWDSVMFHTVIKSRGRIPANDGFIARRVAGPGLASNYFFQVGIISSVVIKQVYSFRLHIYLWIDVNKNVLFFPMDLDKRFKILFATSWPVLRSHQ